jgi:SAM-dependent methyltransferase
MSKTPFYQRYAKRSCAICGSVESKLLFRQTFSEISSGSLLQGYNVVVCNKCGFGFTDNLPDQAAFDVYYREMSKYEHQGIFGPMSKYDMARFKKIVSILRPFLPNTEARILEIGCSTGTLLSLLKKSGYKNVTGVDPSPACAEAAHKLFGIRVLTNTLSDISLENQSIDSLILAGVLEHIHDLGIALARLWNILKDDGIIYVAVPDASRYAEGEDAPYQEFSVEHINFFGPDSLTNLLTVNSFRNIYIKQGMIESNYRTTIPVIHGIYTKNITNNRTSISPDKETEKGLRLYIEKSRQVDNQIRDSIARLVAAEKPIVVWGTGTHTLRLLATSKLGEAKIRAFVDSNPRYQGKLLNNIPIVAPQAIKEWPEPILISSRVYQEEISAQIINDLHLNNEIIRLYCYDQ